MHIDRISEKNSGGRKWGKDDNAPVPLPLPHQPLAKRSLVCHAMVVAPCLVSALLFPLVNKTSLEPPMQMNWT